MSDKPLSGLELVESVIRNMGGTIICVSTYKEGEEQSPSSLSTNSKTVDKRVRKDGNASNTVVTSKKGKRLPDPSQNRFAFGE